MKSSSRGGITNDIFFFVVYFQLYGTFPKAIETFGGIWNANDPEVLFKLVFVSAS